LTVGWHKGLCPVCIIYPLWGKQFFYACGLLCYVQVPIYLQSGLK
jgi:hypothetical protein